MVPKVPAESRQGRLARPTASTWVDVHYYQYWPTPGSTPKNVYTAIETPPHPPGNPLVRLVNWRYVPKTDPQYLSVTMSLTSLVPTIGLGSWFDAESMNYVERHLRKRKWPVPSDGNRGRPSRTAKVIEEREKLPMALRALAERFRQNCSPLQ